MRKTFEAVQTAVVTALTTLVLTASACGPMTLEDKLIKMSRETKVCVDNSFSTHTMRVEIRDSSHGHEYGEVYVQAGATECEWMQLRGGAALDGLIKTTSAPRDVVPPAWNHMRVNGQVMELVVGADGNTLFAHSSRRR